MVDRPPFYKTRQRKAVLDYIRSLKGGHATAAQIVAWFENGAFPIGRTTVYRHLEKLVEDGQVRKYVFDGVSGACFQYIEEPEGAEEHFHLKCEKCGAVVHLEEDALPGVAEYFHEKYRFEIHIAKIVFYGVCDACQRKSEGNGGKHES